MSPARKRSDGAFKDSVLTKPIVWPPWFDALQDYNLAERTILLSLRLRCLEQQSSCAQLRRKLHHIVAAASLRRWTLLRTSRTDQPQPYTSAARRFRSGPGATDSPVSASGPSFGQHH